MTFGALIAEFTTVGVIAAMTTYTACRKLDGRGRTDYLTMTAVAIDSIVSSLERKFGLAIMIEAPRQPLERHVAKGTVLAESNFVNIVVEMTFDALFRRIQKSVRLMTTLALGLSVPP